MSVTAVVGANWGDEGKGRLVDALAARSDVVVRFQGGANAGHTVISDQGKFVFRLLPSGVLHPHVVNVLGPGVAVDPVVLASELGAITSRTGHAPTVRISSRAQLVLPHHRTLDEVDERRLGDAQIGSTRNGIAPHYADKAGRRGITIDDLFDETQLAARLAHALPQTNVLLEHDHAAPVSAPALTAELLAHRACLAPLVCDTTALLEEARKADRRILLEGQLGALRDPDHGIYPWVTSSSTLAGYATVGAGLPPWSITRIIAVTKAYSSCVGAGPFVTELKGSAAEELRRRGGDAGEFGANTRRPRRVGFFDAVATRYGCQRQGATEVALTCLDVLGYLSEIPMCTAYRVGAERLVEFPTTRRLASARPELEMHPGWNQPLGHIRRFVDLPTQARGYVDRLEELIGVEIRWISISPHRDGLIER